MREDLLREVFQDLQETQARNEEIALRRREEVRRKCPEIAEMQEKRERMIQDTLSGILRGEKSPEDLQTRMEEISGKIRAALKAGGYPEDYLSPVYTCPLCRDTGYVGETVKEKCACVLQRYQEKMRRAIGLPEDTTETFESFSPTVFPDQKRPGDVLSQRELMLVARNCCEGWANQFPNQNPRDLILSGKTGVGKTFLLHAMATRLIERGHGVILVSAFRFLDIARKSYFGQDGGMDELIGAEVLMLDDLGSEPMMQNVTVEQVYYLINERQRRNRATVISTNLGREDLRARYTERIASRLTDGRNCRFLLLEGQDIRNGRT